MKHNIGRRFTITNPIFKVIKMRTEKRSFEPSNAIHYSKYISKIFKISKSHQLKGIIENSESLNSISQKLNRENAQLSSNWIGHQRPNVHPRKIFSVKKIKNGINAKLEDLEGSSTSYESDALPINSRIDSPIFYIQRTKKRSNAIYGQTRVRNSRNHEKLFKITRKLTNLGDSTGTENSSIQAPIKSPKYFKIHRNSRKRIKKIINPKIDGSNSAFSKYEYDVNISIDDFFKNLTSIVILNSDKRSQSIQRIGNFSEIVGEKSTLNADLKLSLAFKLRSAANTSPCSIKESFDEGNTTNYGFFKPIPRKV